MTDRGRSPDEVANLGAFLAAAEGYDVIAADDRRVGVVDHVRYAQYADHPDEIIIRRRVLLIRRWGVVPFDAVASVDAAEGIVRLRISSPEIRRLSR